MTAEDPKVIAEPMKLSAEFTLSMARYQDGSEVHYDELLVAAAADQLARQVFKRNWRGDDDEWTRHVDEAEALRNRIVEKVDARIEALVEARVQEMVDSVLAEEFAETNPDGTPTGKLIRIRELIARNVKDQTTITHRDNRGYGKDSFLVTRVDELIKREVQKDLSAAIEEAKQSVRKVIRDKAADVFAQAMGNVR